MKNQEISLEINFETLAILARNESTAPRRSEDPLNLEADGSTSWCSRMTCCP
jgi:hypothetical protein